MQCARCGTTNDPASNYCSRCGQVMTPGHTQPSPADAPPAGPGAPPPANDSITTIIPYRNGLALAAYYCGVFSLIPCAGLLLGPLAFLFGILGLRYARKKSEARGRVHAWIGIILGFAVAVVHVIVIVLMFLPGL